jgi:MtfA peptidase
MPILISAAAIQISFGLNDCELPYYKYIRIHKEEYFAANSLRIFGS